MKTIWTARKGSEIFQLTLKDNVLVETHVWKLSPICAKRKFLQKKRQHIKKGWEGKTLELFEGKKMVQMVQKPRREKKQEKRYIRVLGTKLLLDENS